MTSNSDNAGGPDREEAEPFSSGDPHANGNYVVGKNRPPEEARSKFGNRRVAGERSRTGPDEETTDGQ